MGTALFGSSHPILATIGTLPDTRGPLELAHGTIVGRSRLPTDALGVCAVAIENAVVGSRYRIEVASTGALVADGDVSAANFSVNVPFYAAGNPANTLRLKIRKGTTSPFYRPFETQLVSSESGARAYILQQLDE